MKIVIDIPEDEYKRIKEGKWEGNPLADYIENGTPLPKGHRIGDLDALIRAMKERNDDNGGEPLNAVDRGYDLAYQHLASEANNFVIIEADKGEE